MAKYQMRALLVQHSLPSALADYGQPCVVIAAAASESISHRS